jgi:hypothetical protein
MTDVPEVPETPVPDNPYAEARSQTSPTKGDGMKVIRGVAFIAILLAIVGVGLGAYAAFGKKTNTSGYKAPVAALRSALTAKLVVANKAIAADTAQIAAANAQIATLKASSPNGKVESLSHQLGATDATINQFKVCIPEMEQQFNDQSIQTDTGGIVLGDGTTDTFLTGAYFQDPTIISSNCQHVLTGNTSSAAN